MAATIHTVNLGYNETVELVLPDGRKVNVELSYLEPGSELDIWWDGEMCVNNWADKMHPAKALNGDDHVRLASSVTIPVEPIID